jgi:hypothetical protein
VKPFSAIAIATAMVKRAKSIETHAASIVVPLHIFTKQLVIMVLYEFSVDYLSVNRLRYLSGGRKLNSIQFNSIQLHSIQMN